MIFNNRMLFKYSNNNVQLDFKTLLVYPCKVMASSRLLFSEILKYLSFEKNNLWCFIFHSRKDIHSFIVNHIFKRCFHSKVVFIYCCPFILGWQIFRTFKKNKLLEMRLVFIKNCFHSKVLGWSRFVNLLC